MAKDDDKPYTTKPNSQLDLEARVKAGFGREVVEVDPNEVNHTYHIEGNDTSDYVGVSPEYMNYAEETHKPFKGSGAEADVAKEQLSHFVYSKETVDEPEHTDGSGSSDPLVYVTTSGENVKHKVVDRKEVQAEAEKKATAKADGKKESATPEPTPPPSPSK